MMWSLLLSYHFQILEYLLHHIKVIMFGIGHTYSYCSAITWKYLGGLLLLPSLTLPFIDIFSIIHQNEYLFSYTMSSIIASGMLVIIYTELVLFFSLFARMSYGDNYYIHNSSSFLVIGIIVVLSCASIANSLFATMLCKELITTSLTKLFFNVTGLHFIHVIAGYYMMLHVGELDIILWGNNVCLPQQENYFGILYWYLVEALWLVIDGLIFIAYS